MVFENGSLQYKPSLQDFETEIFNVVKTMIDAVQELPVVDIATVDYKYFTEQLSNVSMGDADLAVYLNRLKQAISILQR
jgi:hypothetical protein